LYGRPEYRGEELWLNKGKWEQFLQNKLRPDATKLTYELSVLVRYITKNLPLSGDSVDLLGPRIVDMRNLLHSMEAHLNAIENKTI